MSVQMVYFHILVACRSTTTRPAALTPTPAKDLWASSFHGKASSGCMPPTWPSKVKGQHFTTKQLYMKIPLSAYSTLNWKSSAHYIVHQSVWAPKRWWGLFSLWTHCLCIQFAAASSHPRPAAGAHLAVCSGDAAARLHAGLGGAQWLRLHQAQSRVCGQNLRPVR